MNKVSIVIPCYNHENYIHESILSVVNQNYSHKEILVIDDGSSDKSPHILKSLQNTFGFELIIQENQGVCKTLNRGIQKSSGDYITFLASDDLMTQNRIQEQVHFLNNHPDVDVVAGAINVIDEKSRFKKSKKVRTNGSITFDQLKIKNMIYAPTAMFRKSVFERFGLYREDLVIEDYYMWLNILSKGGKIYNTNNVWANYRIGNQNLEKRFNWYHKGNNQIFSLYLPQSWAQKRIDHHQLVYCAKMIFLKGKRFIIEYPQEFTRLSIHYRLIVYSIAFIPSKIRKIILSILLREI